MNARSWRPGTRVMRLRASHSYGFVLLLIFSSFLFTASAPDTDWAPSVLVLIQTATLVAAMWSAGMARAFRPALVLLVIPVAAAVVQIVVGGATLTGLVALLNLVLLAGVGVVIVLGVVDQGEVNRQAVTGAICVYVLIGMLFFFAYDAAAAFGSGSFFAQGTDGTPSIRLYFSYVTLATLGYGDYTAAGNFGRTLAVIEALLGQLYLVTVLALLVGRLRPRRSERS